VELEAQERLGTVVIQEIVETQDLGVLEAGAQRITQVGRGVVLEDQLAQQLEPMVEQDPLGLLGILGIQVLVGPQDKPQPHLDRHFAAEREAREALEEMVGRQATAEAVAMQVALHLPASSTGFQALVEILVEVLAQVRVIPLAYLLPQGVLAVVVLEIQMLDCRLNKPSQVKIVLILMVAC